MPRKRITSKRKQVKLNNDQFWDLFLGREFHKTNFRPPFLSPHERQAAWLIHRDELMGNFAEGHPGRRPGAWWTYEAPKVERLLKEDDWEFLIRTGCTDEAERDLIFREYNQHIKIYGPIIREGRTPFGKGLTEYQRQAALLDQHGYPASEMLNEVLKQIKTI